jgi:hypothetical protein
MLDMGASPMLRELDRGHPSRAEAGNPPLCNPVLYPSAARRIEITQEELGLLAGLSRQVVNKSLVARGGAGRLPTSGRGGVRIVAPEALAH